MNYTIKLKGGAKNDIPVLKPREIGICTDTNEVFVGSETGNKDFFKTVNDKIGEGFSSENSISSQLNNLQTNKANKSELLTYEEGKWTPKISGQTTPGVFTYSSQSGYYVKIKNIVQVWFDIAISAINTAGDGALQITGLPFAINNEPCFRSGGIPTYVDNVNIGEHTQFVFDAQPLTTKIYLFKAGSNKTSVPVAIINLSANSRIKGYFTYKIA